MKNLKLTAVFSFLFLIASYSVSAQSNASKFDNEGFEKNKELKSDMKKIKLSSAEAVSFKEITKKYIIKYEDLMETNVSESQRDQKIKEIQEQKNAEMRNVLNEEQYVTYLEIQQEREAALKKINKV
jgi:hypothetical protein